MKKITFRGIRPDDLHGRMALRNPERGFRTEMYASTIPDEIAGMCSCHVKQLKLDGRPEIPIYQNETIPGVPHLIRGNRLTGLEFRHHQWQDELDFFAYDGVCIMQSYIFLQKYQDGQPLPPEKLADIELFFRKLRETGVKALLRFAYELSPSLTGPTGATILKHLEQLAPLIRANSDVIYVLQCGFIGTFGEWHNSFHHLQDDVPFHKELLAAVLQVLPENRKTMLRYPWLKERLYGTDPLTEEEAFQNTPRARIGHFNDGFLASPTHGGTFYPDQKTPMTKEQETEYLAAEGQFLPMDGELFWRDAANHPALPTESARMLWKWHYDTLGFVHGNKDFEGVDKYSIDIWRKVPVDPMFLTEQGLPMPDGYFTDEIGRFVWRSYYEYIRDLLGYRIELQSLEYTCAERLTGKLTLINKGFSAPVNPRTVYLKVGDNAYPLNTDLRKWYSNREQIIDFDLPAPEKTCKIGLWMPDEAETLKNDERYAIRCANAIPFRDGVNILGEIEV